MLRAMTMRAVVILSVGMMRLVVMVRPMIVVAVCSVPMVGFGRFVLMRAGRGTLVLCAHNTVLMLHGVTCRCACATAAP